MFAVPILIFVLNVFGMKTSANNGSRFFGVPQTNETISDASGPKFTILWAHVGEILLLNKFFFDCRYMP